MPFRSAPLNSASCKRIQDWPSATPSLQVTTSHRYDLLFLFQSRGKSPPVTVPYWVQATMS
eukprot:631756-Pelagomonas_calceolata.AAC.5